MTITPLQCRMARAALDLSVRDLARQAGLSVTSVSRFENGQPMVIDRLERLRAVLEEAGLVFIAEDAAQGAGLRLAKMFRKGFIYDADGKQVASIVGEAVIDVARQQRIATVRGDDLYTLAGESVGMLGAVDVTQRTGSLSEPALTLLMTADAGPSATSDPSPLASLDILLEPP